MRTPVAATGSDRLVRRIAALVGAMACGLAVLLAVLPSGPVAADLRAGGAAGAVLGALLLALGGMAPVARWWQGVIVPMLAAAALVVLWRLRPTGALPEPAMLMAGAAVPLAFPLLLAERTLAAAGMDRLAALLVLPLAALVAHGVLAGLGDTGSWGLLAAQVVSAWLSLVGLELLLRGLAQWFLPQPAAAASLLARLAYPAGWTSSGVAAPLRDNFGIDFSRSWALRYLRAAALPMLLLTLLFCWGLTGLRMVELDRRAVYERLGVPVAVLKPGLHLILPWPLGALRGTEFGVVHALPLGPGGTATPDRAAAEDALAPAADRLWDQTHQNELAVLIASATDGRQSFQTVGLDLRVLYRIGLDDAAVLRSVYGEADPQALVQSAAGRLLAHDFAGRSLAGALGESREALADHLRAALQTDLDAKASGIEVLAVVIEGIHPPAGAADAYHRVQAAEILADASVNNERGRAAATASYAQQEARDRLGRAQAASAERVASANADSSRFAADVRAAQAGGPAFVLERYFADLRDALSRATLVIVDHRLSAPDAPVLDLRPLSATAAPRGPLDED